MNKEVEIELNKILEYYNYNSIENINWNKICVHWEFSENFIKEFCNKINWFNMSVYRSMPKNIIKEFKHKLNLGLMLQNNKITQEFYNELIKPKIIPRYELLDLS